MNVEQLSSQQEEEKSKKDEIISFIKDIIIILVSVLIIKTFFIVPFMINGQSMYDSYYDKEFIIVDRISYILGEPDRGDVIVFRPEVDNKKEYFLKRIIGIPGDTLKIENGRVSIKDESSEEFKLLDETYLDERNKNKTTVSGSTTEKLYTLGENQYFVMGDNRNSSTDSRECFGNCYKRSELITEEDMVGKVLLDLGYFNFRNLRFIHPELGIKTNPRFFSSPSTHTYSEL